MMVNQSEHQKHQLLHPAPQPLVRTSSQRHRHHHVLPPARRPLSLVTVRTELLRDVAVEAAQELRLPVPPVIDPPLEIHIALERQTLLDLRRDVSGQGGFPVKIPAPYKRFRGLAYRFIVVHPLKLDKPSLVILKISYKDVV